MNLNNPTEFLSALNGSPAPSPSGLSSDGGLESRVLSAESGGKRYGADGNILTSPKGAKGEMQVLDSTNTNPGFGVRPAQDDSPEERARVGRDYLGALNTVFMGDQAKTAAAYNAGPGRVMEAIKKHGDNWLAHVPPETQAYVQKVAGETPAASTTFTPMDTGDEAGYVRKQVAKAQGPSFGDYLKTFGASALSAGGDILNAGGEALAAGANAVTNSQDYSGFNPLKSTAEKIRGTLTEGGKAAREDQASGDLDPSTWKLPEKFSGYAMTFADGMGSLAPNIAMMFTGVGEASAMYKAGSAAMKVAQAAGDAAGIAKASEMLAKAGSVGRTAALWNATSEGAMTAGNAASGARENVNKLMSSMTHDQLMQSVPAYADAYQQYGNERDARNAVANHAAALSGTMAGLMGATGGAWNAKVVEDVLAKKGVAALLGKTSENRAVRAAVGGLTGIATEAPQEGLEQVGQNVGENVALGVDPMKNAGRELFPNMLGGALVGHPVGMAAGALSEHEAAAPAPVPVPANSPLQSAVAASTPAAPAATAAGDPFAARVHALDAQLGPVMQTMRATPGYGAEGVDGMLSAFARAKNPTTDPAMRERLLNELEQHVAQVANRPNFTMPPQQGEAPAQQGTALATVGGREVAQPGMPDLGAMGNVVDGQAREVTPANPQIAPRGTPQIAVKPPVDSEYEAQYSDLLKLEQLDKERASLQQLAHTDRQAAARLQEIDQAIQGNRALETAQKRSEILHTVLGDPTTANPAERFRAELARKGFNDTRVTPGEQQLIARHADLHEAFSQDQSIEPSAPNELDAAALGVPEKGTIAPKTGTTGIRPGVLRLAGNPGNRIKGDSILNRNGMRIARLNAAERAALGVQDSAPFTDSEQEQSALAQNGELVNKTSNSPVNGQNTDLSAAAESAPSVENAHDLSTSDAENSRFANSEDGTGPQETPDELPVVPNADAPTSGNVEGVASDVDAAAHEAATSPLNDKPQPDAEAKESSDYDKGQIEFSKLRLKVEIENPAGSVRSGADSDGKAWSQTMVDHYGDIVGTKGADGDPLDVFVVPGLDSDWKGNVYVINQKNADGSFDEHKAVIGATSEEDAKAIYRRNYEPGWDGIMSVAKFAPMAFKAWAKSGDLNQPAGKASSLPKTEAAPEAAPAANPQSNADVVKSLIATYKQDGEGAARKAFSEYVKANGLSEPEWKQLRAEFKAAVEQDSSEKGSDFSDGKSEAAPAQHIEAGEAEPATPASWVIRNKATGEVLMETFDRAKVDALNTEKYEAIPIQQHLAELSQTAGKWSRMSVGERMQMIRRAFPKEAADTDIADRYAKREWSDLSKGEQGSFAAAMRVVEETGGPVPHGVTLENVIAAGDSILMKPKQEGAAPEQTANEEDGSEQPKQQQEAIPTVEKAEQAMEPTWDSFADFWNGIVAGKVSNIEDVKEAFSTVLDRAEEFKASIGKLKNDQLKRMLGGWARPDDRKADLVSKVYDSTLTRFTLNKDVPSKTWVFGENVEKVNREYNEKLRGIVNGLTSEDLAEFQGDVAKAQAERESAKEARAVGVADPKTLEDFDNYTRTKHAEGLKNAQEIRMSLSPEQRAAWDNLRSEKSRADRNQQKEARATAVNVAGQLVDGKIVETQHTKHGHDLFVVQLAERVSREDYDTLNTGAKKLGGGYSSYRGAGATPGFQFRTKEAAEAFVQLAGGDTTAARGAIEARRDAFADDRTQSAAERLAEMADAIDERASESLSRDRKANTDRRARFAAAAERTANQQKALAETMRNIAKALTDGSAKFLDRVRQKTQVEFLRSAVHTALSNQWAQSKGQTDGMSRPILPKLTQEAADFAEWPAYTMYRSDWASLGRRLQEEPGSKKLGQNILKVADDVTDTYLAWAKENISQVGQYRLANGERAILPSKKVAEEAIERGGFHGKAIVLPIKRNENMVILSPAEARKQGLWTGDDDKRITLTADAGAAIVEQIGKANRRGARMNMPWQLENAYDRRKRLDAMGIKNPWELRAALREFIGLQEQPAEEDAIKKLERSMVGRANDGLDFFPTSAEVVSEMLDAAELQPGMRVLEPSAGMGHIADQIREAGIDPEVIEYSPKRRELLDAKGYNVVGDDFTAFDDANQADRNYTYGDVFRAPDGVLGVVRGSGGMGSGRVGFQPLDENGKPDARTSRWENFSDLEGVEKRGVGSGYDRIIMNPPFSKRQDAEHVMHAYGLLKPGGRIVAIMGEGVFNGQDKKAQAFREWLDSVGGSDEKLPEGSFNDPSLPVNTGANARMIVIDKSGNDKGSGLDVESGESYHDKYERQAQQFNDSDKSTRMVADAPDTGGLDSGGGRGGRYVTVADGIAADFKARGATSLIGKEVRNSHDLAVLAQVYRDPRLETVRYFFTRNGEIVSQNGVSSRKPGTSRVLVGDTAKERHEYFDEIARQAKALGADSVWMLHNHPNGDPTASPADISATINIAEGMEARGLKMPGHVIINHNKYGVIDISPETMSEGVMLHDFGPGLTYNIEHPKKAHPVIGQRITGPESLASVAKQAQVSPGQIVIIGTAGTAGVRVVVELTPRQMTPGFAAGMLRRIAKQSGSSRLFAYGVPGESYQDVRKAMQSGLLTDAIIVENGVEYSALGFSGDRAAPGMTLGSVNHGYEVSMPEYQPDDDGKKVDQTETPAFKKWFGDSKVVDADGKPLRVYHGTDRDVSSFDAGAEQRAAKYFGAGTYFTNAAYQANGYAGTGDGANVLPVYLSLQNPFVEGESTFNKGRPLVATGLRPDLIQKAYEKAGFDGVMLKRGWQIAFLPQQIKSATGNRGTFDPNDSNILFSRTSLNARNRPSTTLTDLNAITQPIVDGLKGRQVHRVQSLSQAPKEVIDDIKRRKINPKQVEGFFIDGAVWLIADNLHSPERALEVLAHEATHFGLRGMFGRDLDPILMQIYTSNPEAREYARQYRDEFGKKAEPIEIVRAVEEYLAHLGEGRKKLKGWAKLVAHVRQWLRKLGGVKEWTDADAELLVSQAIDFFKRGKAQRDWAQGTVFSLDGDVQYSLASDETPDDGGPRGGGAPVPTTPSAATSFAQKAMEFASAAAQPTARSFGPLKNIRTQLDKAMSDKDYGRVYRVAEDHARDMARATSRPASHAPSIIPAFSGVKSSLASVKMVAKLANSMPRVFDMLAKGTLAGESALDGKVWTHKELADKFGATPEEIGLYDEARAAIDASLTESAASFAWRAVRRLLDPSVKQELLNNPAIAPTTLLDALEAEIGEAGPDRARAKQLIEARETVQGIFDRADQLAQAGYAPLTRFGQYTVDVVQKDANGNIAKDKNGDPIRLSFSRHEFEYEAKQAAAKLEKQYANDPNVAVQRGVMDSSSFQLFQGVDPEAVALFIDKLNFDDEAEQAGFTQELLNEAKQQWMKRAVSDRSAFKRLVERKGIAGFSDDLPRVIASYITSNARMAGKNWHGGDMMEAIDAIPKSKGDVKDEAVQLKQYLENPKEPFSGVRGLMFAWYMGGSAASALVNLTQPAMMTFPFLSQFGAGKAMVALRSSMKYAVNPDRATGELASALERAQEEGWVDPQETHHVFREGMDSVLKHLPLGRNAQAVAQALMTTWGSLFQYSEAFNRRLSFAAAFKMATDNPEITKGGTAYDFAVDTVKQTQGVMEKHNRPNWARGSGAFGAVGAAAFTFKQYSIAYVELVTRLLRSKEPGSKRAGAIMLGTLVLASGLQGIPGADDLDDLVDTILQSMGYMGNTKKAKREFFSSMVGQDMADVLMYGMSAVTPLDVSGRVGLGNLLPATGVFKASEKDKAGQMMELLGAPGSMAANSMKAIDAFQSGQIGNVMTALAPLAIGNAMKAWQMADTGEYVDMKGRKVGDVSMMDAFIKAVGFQPNSVAEGSRVSRMVTQDINRIKDVKSDLAALKAQGVAEGDAEIAAEAVQRMREWNDKNPDARVSIDPSSVARRVKEFRMDRAARMTKSAPKGMRAIVAAEMEGVD